MPNRNIVIAIFAVALAVAFAIVMFTTINQAPTTEGSVTSTESENRGNDTGIAPPVAPPDENFSPSP
jgi:hypothetical protein